MKLMWKLMLAVLVISMLLPFTLLKDDTGSTLLKFPNLKWPDWRKTTNILLKAVKPPDAEKKGTETIYQWVDAEGNTQFSNTPPPAGIEFKVKHFDPELNVIQSVTPKTGALKESAKSAEDTLENKITSTEDLGNPYSADRIKKLFEDTKNIEKLLNQRLQKQEAAFGQ